MYCMECWKYVGLTLTWDVLKPVTVTFTPSRWDRLTLTWDVLKRKSVKIAPGVRLRLTLTWDVLKLLQGDNPKQDLED